MKPLVLFIVFGLLRFTLISEVSAQVKIYADKSKSSITYSMKHPLHSWEGISKDVNSVIVTDENRSNITQAAVSVKISSFDSQNANRDSHMIEVTEAIKYSNISFVSTSINQDGTTLTISGKLTFHGITKDISVKAEKVPEGAKTKITGNFSINMKDYNVDPPSLMAIPTDEEINLSFVMVY